MLRVPLHKYGYAVWLNVGDHFDVDFHIRRLEGIPENHDVISESELLDHISRVAHRPFAEGRPSWEILYIPNVTMNTKGSNEQLIPSTVFFLRSHHSYSDLIHLLNNFLFRLSDSRITMTTKYPKLSWFQNLLIFLEILFCFPRVMNSLMFSRKSPLNSQKLTGEKILSISDDINLNFVKNIRKIYDVTFNSILLSSIGEALGKFLSNKFESNVQTLDAVFSIVSQVPIYGDMGILNSSTGCHVKIPVMKLSQETRLYKIHNDVPRELRKSVLYKSISFISNKVPIFGMSAPGFPSFVLCYEQLPNNMRMENEDVDFVYFWGSNAGMNGLTFTAISSNGVLKILLIADKKVVSSRKDADKILSDAVKYIHDLNSKIE